MIFVFGSNLAGIHGAGAARHALEQEGAVWGYGVGPIGNSYAIPTKDYNIHSLSLDLIMIHVQAFISYAELHPELEFKVTRIGCGLAGFTNEQIAPMFERAPNNCLFDTAWQDYLDCRHARRYWGHG